MKIHCFDEDNLPDKEILEGLVGFEASFTYPLGQDQTFTISHAPEYLRFYQSMGESVCFVAQSDKTGAILGTVSAVLRSVTCPAAAGQVAHSKLAVYIGDLKLAASARKGFALLRLARAVESWVLARTDCAYSVVMDGTELTPPTYTGRAGIDAFSDVGRITVYFVDLCHATPIATADAVSQVDSEAADALFAALTGSCGHVSGGNPATRSELAPVWLASTDKQACGRLEDTIRAKKLMLGDAQYLKAAHLGDFAFATIDSGVQVLNASLNKAGELGYEYLIFAVDSQYAASFDLALSGRSTYSKGGATVFATDKLLPGGSNQSGAWIINTAEI